MPKHLPVYKDRHFFLHQRDQDKFFRVFHLDHSVTESGSQPGHPAQQPYDMEQEKAWGSANLTQGSHSNKTSSVAPRLPTASGASQYFSKRRVLTEGRAGRGGDPRPLNYKQNKAGFSEIVSQGVIRCSMFGAGNKGVPRTTVGVNF